MKFYLNPLSRCEFHLSFLVTFAGGQKQINQDLLRGMGDSKALIDDAQLSSKIVSNWNGSWLNFGYSVFNRPVSFDDRTNQPVAGIGATQDGYLDKSRVNLYPTSLTQTQELESSDLSQMIMQQVTPGEGIDCNGTVCTLKSQYWSYSALAEGYLSNSVIYPQFAKGLYDRMNVPEFALTEPYAFNPPNFGTAKRIYFKKPYVDAQDGQTKYLYYTLQCIRPSAAGSQLGMPKDNCSISKTVFWY